MNTEVTRQRIEKYLDAHGVECTEPVLMKLTRHLIDKAPEEAKEELKLVIIRHNGSGYFDIEETVFELVSEKYFEDEKVYLVPTLGTSGTVTRRVTKKEYIIDNIIGFSVTGFVVVCIVGGILKAIFN